MFKVNQDYLKLPGSYLFSTIGKKVAAFQQANPDKSIIRLGIGDVTQPLAPALIDALHGAVEEMAHAETFRGYAPDLGYEFLRSAIAKNDYQDKGCDIKADEIFISDGAKCDSGNIQEIFSKDNKIAVCDPVYPVYVDTNRMAGRQVRYLDASRENGFLPMPEEGVRADLIYLCSPNNPTGAVYSREQLKAWVEYALEQNAVILFDAAYEAFIRDEALPRSIYEIEGAERCAIEFCSFSKTAGFTGTRCGWTVVPLSLETEGMSLNHMWLRRQTTKFNGVPYIVQRGAAAVFTPEGQRQTAEGIAYYRENAHLIADALTGLGIWYTGGVNSPYVWLACPDGMDSWTFFDRLLEKAQEVGTPGAGFGRNGEGYFRLTAFGDRDRTRQAVERLRRLSLSGR